MSVPTGSTKDEIAKVKIKLLTPLRVGSGERYLTSTVARAADRWFRLSFKGFYKHVFSKNQAPVGPTELQIKSLQRGEYLYELVPRAVAVHGFSEIQGMLHHPSGACYIPGSSIKGMFRLAFARLLARALRDEFINKLELDIKNKRKVFENSNALLNSYMRGGKLRELHQDLFRFLQISDTDIKEVPTELWRAKILKVYSDKVVDKGTDFLVETIPAGTVFEFTIRLRHADLRRLIDFEKVTYKDELIANFTLEGLFKAIAEFYRKAISDEFETLSAAQRNAPYLGSIVKFYQDIQSKNVLRFADGGGLMFNSLLSILKPDRRIAIRNIIRFHGNDPAPLTRNYLAVASENRIGELIQMGWCEYQVERV